MFPVDPYLVLHAASDFYRTSPTLLQSPSRIQPLAFQRQVVYYMLREFSKLSYPKIGQFMHRDHSTVMYGIEQVDQRALNDEGIETDLENLRSYIKLILEQQ